jgi:hypothetical protein
MTNECHWDSFARAGKTRPPPPLGAEKGAGGAINLWPRTARGEADEAEL